MNSTSLYVTTNQIILNSDPNQPNSWQDLYRLVPYLRNSLCCVVCGYLLMDPLTPSVGRCQHHLCKHCIRGRKNLKPTCSWCKNQSEYFENKSMRILLQCYKKMCSALVTSVIYKSLVEQASKQTLCGVDRGAGSLLVLIKEGASFKDDYRSTGGLTKSAYSVLPCVYTNSSTQTLQPNNVNSSKAVINSTLTNRNRTSIYSVMFAGNGNKITIKRKSKESTNETLPKNVKHEVREKSLFKKPMAACSLKLKRGCRCGNATLTPGKLTCCGQRCPCYVNNEACLECKCRGCRNPHQADGNKALHGQQEDVKFYDIIY